MVEPTPVAAVKQPLVTLGRLMVTLAAVALISLLLGPGTWFEALNLDPLGAIAGWWSGLWGRGSLPVVLALGAGGLGLLSHQDRPIWTLPWLRVVAFELGLLAGLALATLWLGDVEGGLVGLSLAEAARIAVGPRLAGPLWAGIALLALWLALGAALPAALTSRLRIVLGEGDLPLPVAASPVRAAPARRGQVIGSSAPRPPRESGIAASVAVAIPAAAEVAAEPGLLTTQRTPTSARPRLPAIRVHQTSGRRPMPAAGPGRRGRDAQLPPLRLLDEPDAAGVGVDAAGLRSQAARIEHCLAGFGIPVEVVEIEPGPSFTRFALKPGMVMRAGEPRRVRLSRITAHRHDLTLALSAEGLRIEAPIPGRSVVGIEIPKRGGQVVTIRGILQDPAFQRLAADGGLPLAIGRQVGGQTVIARLTGMPHLLVAGATGSGKSVFMNSVLISLITQHTPDQVRLILIDPKRVELGRYARLPHLVAAPITDPAEAVAALRWAVTEMEDRYRLLADRGVRDRAGFNRLIPAGEAVMPALVIVIDELADLMMTAPGEVEPMLTRLAQMGRATGIHLVVATQRPSVDVITGIIKANFPSRVAFLVSSGIDSRVILDQLGAESLMGSGDLLYQPSDQPHLVRAQAAWVSDAEIERVLAFWSESSWQPPATEPPWADLMNEDPDAALYLAAQEIALANPHHSASLLQRRLRIGYAKAKLLYDRLLEDGFESER
ncbi:MAG TPA: DNA translocase FtsK [Anaerolineae bacterium]|nr:DNA translocase FtsK [Ardenticatenia bacterium]MBK8538469.1 DNA translocase FtsK [Ardenticatenia bacterium]HQZ71408.1 DNA translocase FtsK [Anaerolineae bacterium]HRA19470.1 DNA translocase FtsK [Anaerolineae bacterium]